MYSALYKIFAAFFSSVLMVVSIALVVCLILVSAQSVLEILAMLLGWNRLLYLFGY